MQFAQDQRWLKITYPNEDHQRVKFHPIFKNHDACTRKQERGWLNEFLQEAEVILHEEVPGDITAFSCMEHQEDNVLTWVYIKNGSAEMITLVCRFVLWDADCHINIDPDGFLLLRDIDLENYIPHIDDDSGIIFKWPGEIPGDLEEFIHIMPGETCWEWEGYWGEQQQ